MLSAERKKRVVNKVFYSQDSFSLILKCVIVFWINYGNEKKKSEVAHREITLFKNK